MGGRIDAAGNIDLVVNVPRRPNGFQAQHTQTLMQQQFIGANQILCDATDGELRIRSVRQNFGAAGRRAADVWWVDRTGGRAHADLAPAKAGTPVTRFGTDWGHATVYGGFWERPFDPVHRRAAVSMRSDILAHELGHVWVSTHHPYLQTERLANSIAMRVVSRDSLERVYEKMWARDGRKGDLLAFLGPRTAPDLH